MVTFVAAARTWLACAFRRFASLFLRMIWSENRTPLFGIMRGGGDFFLAWWWLAKLGRDCAARTIFHVVIASGSEAIQFACAGSGFLRRVAPRNDVGGQLSAITSSLPGLTRQSMRGFGSLRSVALFDSRPVSMDHRVKPGGDDGERDEAQRDDACSSLRA
jgi:hypothetical protein